MQIFSLTHHWQLKAGSADRDPARIATEDFSNPQGWLTATVPGVVHQDLIAAGQIPDPFYGLNEREVQWVGERDWLYRCAFEVTSEALAEGALDLCFDGLDTFATVLLNGTPILTSDNMFVPHRLPVKHILKLGANELQILFESALLKGKALEASNGQRRLWNGDSSRLYVRKAQYHYGWDWGPTLLTAGPWRAVRLEAYTARIAEVNCPATVAPDLGTALLPVTVTWTGPSEGVTVRLELGSPSGQLVATAALSGEVGAHTFTVTQPQLWWPNGHGPQPLYTLTAILERQGEILDRHEQRLGLRRLRLVQEPLADEPGATFLFEINNRPIFCGGANWIPADSFTPRLTRERYQQLLQAATEAHMTMLRVWGGGIYEDDVFYDLCDELGLLVWQDFMFACGLYPAHPAFQASVRAEAEANVRRLRHHPSLVLWCGNNEDYQIASSLKAYDENFQGDFTPTPFPARAIYEHVLPEVCAALDPTRPYWRGSPYGGPDANSQVVGDRHTWDIWHGVVAPYQNYPKYEGRFVSEFGMMSFPALKTIEAFAPAEERYPQSRTLEHHNKADGGVRRVATYLSENVRLPNTFSDYVYATQFIQAEALASAYRGWRRRWAGPGRYAVAGALVWQLEDCWPVSSWAIIDSALRVKPAYYAIRRALAPVALGLGQIMGGAQIWAVNEHQETISARLVLQAWALDGHLVSLEERAVTVLPNQATELGEFRFDVNLQLVLGARLLRENTILARATLWPEPFKYLALPEPNIALTRSGEHLTLRAAKPAKGVWLEAGDGIDWSDNLIDLVPNEDYAIRASGLGEQQVNIRWLS